MKKPEDALNADRMNVKDGGKQPFMKDTTWNGVLQKMTRGDGVQKGMKTVLEERGVDTHGMNAQKLREELLQFEVHTQALHAYNHVSNNLPNQDLITKETSLFRAYTCIPVPSGTFVYYLTPKLRKPLH